MTRTVAAVYSNGVLKPDHPLEGVAENERLLVTVHSLDPSHPLAGVVGTLPDEDAREMMKIIDEEFGKVDPDDWK